ncbi:hypothetical protein HF086_016137 [Spodoptera exigua]|uniref:Cytochrome p450 n=1 Tax=Spodoptera exigua TaxID=7107 RepID=A0A922MS55_SPOEX|nr:hypothetical protein HF086_016137 [Spodoptera exigua]
MILFLVSVIFVLVLLVSWIRLVRESRRFNINGPMPLPIIGNAHMFVSKSTEFLNLLAHYADKYGKVYREIVTGQEYISKGGPYKLLSSWLGKGLLTATGQRWKSHRKFLTPAFHFTILQNFLPVFCKNQRVLTEKLRELADGRPIDMFPIVALAALDNVTESIMGSSVDAQGHESESAYVKSIEEMSSILAMRIQIPIFGPNAIFNLTPYKISQVKALKVLHGHTRKVIEARRQELKKANITSLDASTDVGIRNKHAFLDLLLLGEIDGKKIDDESVREEVDTFMFEGHDTTTSGISYVLYCLSKRRHIQEKIYEELQTIFGQKFAMMELKITISEIVKHFHILPVDEPPQLSADLILRSKNGVKVRLMPRK